MAGYLLFRAWDHLFSPASEPTLSPEQKQLNELLEESSCTVHDVSAGRLPEVRFRLSDGSIYGFPPVEPGSTWPSYFVIEHSPPAVRSYVLGSDWQSRLTKTAQNDQSNNAQECIPRPSDPLDEAKHCILMKRCGARLCHTTSLFAAETYGGRENPYHELSKKQIMGWPSTGGVWVCRLTSALLRDLSLDEGLESLARIQSGEKADHEQELSNMKQILWQQPDMEGYCKVLQDNGAVFCENPAECPEVTMLGLLENDGLENTVEVPNHYAQRLSTTEV